MSQPPVAPGGSFEPRPAFQQPPVPAVPPQWAPPAASPSVETYHPVPVGASAVPPQMNTTVNVVLQTPPKDTTAAYLLLIFLGGFGAHHFYLRQPVRALLFLAATIVGTPLMVAWGIGLIFLIPLWIAEIVDLFTLPSQVRHANTKLLAAQQGHPGPAVPIR